jgi:hypothetical protein
MTEKIDRDIDQMFSEELLPLAARLKREGVKFLDAQPEKDAASYFVRRAKIGMARIDFESGGCASPATVEADLARLWNRGNDGSLATLAPGMATLARTLRQVQAETADVSNFIYVMY